MRTCPKCETAAPDEAPCPRCGLAPAHAAAWQARDEIAPTATIGAAWERIEAGWDDETVHERAAGLAIAGGELAWLASRYRGVLRARPEDAIAARQLARLSRRAEATLMATGSGRPTARATPRLPWGAVIAICLVVAGGTLYAMHVIQQRREAERQTDRVRPAERIAPPPGQR